MLKYIILFVSLICTSYSSILAQEVTWSEEIAPIFFQHCTNCHHDGGIAPFPLVSYEEVMLYSELIHEVVEHREMPPWPADPNYRHFVDELYLSDVEIQLIEDWVHDDFPAGDINEMPVPPTYGEEGSLLESIDYVVAIEPYELQSNTDEYRWFVVETDFTETVYISHLEVIPGLENVVHHVDLAYDLTGVTLQNDLADPLPGFNSSTGSPNYNYYINAWQPGGNLATYPENWGIAVPPGADFVVEIHYGPGGQGSIDSTKMHLQFIQNPEDVRPVQVSWLLTDAPPVLIDGPLVIPANEEVVFHQQTAPLANDMSLISICPHMHFLGKSYKIWAIPPDGDTIPLIDIPHWDFHWQRYYEFQQILKLPAGTVIESEGWYDNTTANHDNPSSPPQTVYRGTKTTDEMFLCYFIFAPYEDGDEEIVIDSTILISSQEIIHKSPNIELFPNPANDKLLVKSQVFRSEKINLKIVNVLGQIVFNQQFNSSVEALEIGISALETGLYFLHWETDSKKGTRQFVKE